MSATPTPWGEYHSFTNLDDRPLGAAAVNACHALGVEPDKLVERVRQTVGVLGLVLEAMRSGKPYWHGEPLQGQVAAALALWEPDAISETAPE